MALKLKIDKDDPIELAVMTVTDVDSARTWLKKNSFRVIATVPPIDPNQTTMLTICGRIITVKLGDASLAGLLGMLKIVTYFL